jgi:hypothetical protein
MISNYWFQSLFVFCQSFDEWPNLREKILASVDLLPHILLIELCEFNVIAFLPITEQSVVEIAMVSSEPTTLNKVLVERCTHPAMLLESTPFFQKQCAYSVK